MQKTMLNFWVILAAFWLMMPIVSAGLEVLTPLIEVNKTYGIPTTATIQIRNNEAFEFRNVSLASNNYTVLSPIDILASGQTVNATLTILTNESFDAKTIRVRGFYATNVGPSNVVYEANVTAFQVNLCNPTIIEGDRIRWTSRLQSQIVMVDADTGLPIDGSTLSFNQTFEKQFTTPQTFRYYFSVSGFAFPETCTVTVLSGNGLVNDPNNDASFTLKVHQILPQTIINVVIPQTDYSMNFFDVREGSLTIVNNGNETAQNILLLGEWFTFNRNNFNLAPGESLPVTFTIRPVVQQTADTNRSYNKTIFFSGNFGNITKSINIFIRYAIITGNISDTANATTLKDFICYNFPEFCNPQIVYTPIPNSSFNIANFNITREQWNALLLGFLEEQESRKNDRAAFREMFDSIVNSTRGTEGKVSDLDQKYATLEERTTTNQKNLLVFVGIVLSAGLIGMAGYVVLFIKRKKMLREFDLR